MRVFPTARNEWIRLLIVANAAYMFTAVPLAMAIPAVDTFHGNNESLAQVLPGYWVCLLALLTIGCIGLALRVWREASVALILAGVALRILSWPWFHL